MCFNRSNIAQPAVRGGRWGGIIVDPGGKTESTFAWGLRNSSNNQAEAYVLLQDLRIDNESLIHTLIVVGDSSAIINQMVLKSSPADYNLASILAQAHLTKLHSTEGE